MVEMSKEYARTLEEDKRDRAFDREMGVDPRRIPVEHQLVVIVDEDGQWKWIEAKPLSNWAMAALSGVGWFITWMLVMVVASFFWVGTV